MRVAIVSWRIVIEWGISAGKRKDTNTKDTRYKLRIKRA